MPGVEKTMHEFKQGKLRSGSGGKVTSREQAIAIALSQEREAKKKKKTDGETIMRMRSFAGDAKRKPPDDDNDNDDDDEDDYGDSVPIQMTDNFTLDANSVRKTQDGFLVANARIARTGIQLYTGHEVGLPDREVVRIYRPPEEVFDRKTMRSMAMLPITLNHPPSMVDSTNWKQFAIGDTGEDVVRDGECVRVPMIIKDAKAIEAYEKDGVRELSVGYGCELKWGRGETPNGEIYDAKQTAIRGNHLAVVPAARGGSLLRIGDDQQGASEMAKLLIDGQSIDFSTELAAKHVQDHLTNLLKQITDANNKASTAEAEEEQEEQKRRTAEKDAESLRGEVAVLKKQLEDAVAKSSPAAIDKEVKDRTELMLKADAAMEGKTDFAGKGPDEIRRIVVQAKMGDAAKDMTDGEIVGAFKAITANIKPRSGTDRLADSLSMLQHGGGNANNPQAIKDAAYEEYTKNLTGAWRTARAS